MKFRRSQGRVGLASGAYRKPGLQQFLRSIENIWVGDEELFDGLLLDPS